MPPNTTFYFDLQDTTTGEDIGQLLKIHINDFYAEGLTTCQVDYSGVTTPTPSSGSGVSVSATSSAYAGGGGTSSSSVVTTILNGTTSDTEAEGNGHAPSHSSDNGSLKAAYAGISILALALAAMLFMQYRLRKQLARLQKGQSTVGRWMNHQNVGFSGAQKKRQNFRNDADDNSVAGSHEGQDMRPMSNASNLYATSEYSGQLSSFFEYRSASRAGAAQLRSRPASRDLTSTMLTRQFSSPSSSGGGNPFDDDAHELLGDEVEDDLLHRSASQQQRYSQAESAISNSNTATSGRLSSVAPSDQLSSVGNVSVVSDDHYHRNKAFTITTSGHGSSGSDRARQAGQFLDPHMGLLGSRR